MIEECKEENTHKEWDANVYRLGHDPIVVRAGGYMLIGTVEHANPYHSSKRSKQEEALKPAILQRAPTDNFNNTIETDLILSKFIIRFRRTLVLTS